MLPVAQKREHVYLPAHRTVTVINIVVRVILVVVVVDLVVVAWAVCAASAVMFSIAEVSPEIVFHPLGETRVSGPGPNAEKEREAERESEAN